MKINIIGGGIAGLTTGLALEKLGLEDYCIFERAPKLNEVGAGIMLQPNAMRVLDWLGIGDKIRKAGNPIGLAEITDRNLVSVRQASQRFDEDHIEGTMIAIHRARLQKILFDALPINKIRLNQTLVDYRLEGHSIQSIFSQGSENCDVLLAADGINSTIRQKLFPSSQIRYSGQTCWRGIATLSVRKDERPIAREAWGPKLRFGFARISGREMYWYAVVNAAAGGKDQGSFQENLLNKFRDFHPLVGEIIQQTAVEKIIRDDIYDLKRLPVWSTDNICLIGDAAHATTPNLGQGACQGIEDAYYISRALYDFRSDCNAAFGRFESDRRKKVDHVVNTSWRLGKVAHQPLLAWVTRFLMSVAPERIISKQMSDLFRVDGLN